MWAHKGVVEKLLLQFNPEKKEMGDMDWMYQSQTEWNWRVLGKRNLKFQSHYI